jgi:hypothetical protein
MHGSSRVNFWRQTKNKKHYHAKYVEHQTDRIYCCCFEEQFFNLTRSEFAFFQSRRNRLKSFDNIVNMVSGSMKLPFSVTRVEEYGKHRCAVLKYLNIVADISYVLNNRHLVSFPYSHTSTTAILSNKLNASGF